MSHATLDIHSGDPPSGFFGKVGDLPGTLFFHKDGNPPHALLYSWGERPTPDFVFVTRLAILPGPLSLPKWRLIRNRISSVNMLIMAFENQTKTYLVSERDDQHP